MTVPCLQQSTLLGSFVKVAKSTTPSASAPDSKPVTEQSAIKALEEGAGPGGGGGGGQDSGRQGRAGVGQREVRESPKRQKTCGDSKDITVCHSGDRRSHLQPLDNRASLSDR